jgi:L-arabinonolactonase
VPEFRVIADPKTILGEGPLWDVRTERLYWVDSVGGYVFRSTAEGGEVAVWRMPSMIGAMALREEGGAIITLTDGISLLDFDTGELSSIGNPEAGKLSRFNDGKTDRQGRFVTGTMDFRLIDPSTSWLIGKTPAESGLYRVDPDLSITKVQPDIGITNGPCFSPDGTTLYLSDSWRDEILAFDYDIATGDLSNRRVFASYHGDKGSTGQAQPDGATVDEEGFVWSVAVYAGELRRFAPDGSLDRRIDLPVVKATSVAFGGPDLDILYLTSMAHPDLPIDLPREGPLAGSLFAIHGLGVRGIPEVRFQG